MWNNLKRVTPALAWPVTVEFTHDCMSEAGLFGLIYNLTKFLFLTLFILITPKENGDISIFKTTEYIDYDQLLSALKSKKWTIIFCNLIVHKKEYVATQLFALAFTCIIFILSAAPIYLMPLKHFVLQQLPVIGLINIRYHHAHFLSAWKQEIALLAHRFWCSKILNSYHTHCHTWRNTFLIKLL